MLTIRKSDNKKWQKRPQLYRGRFFYLKQIVNVALAIFCLGIVISLLLYFQKSDTLYVKRIDVLGHFQHLTKDDIISLSGIKKTDHLFSVDLRSVRQSISRYPWVANVKVRREFPDTIQIHVTEREPQALLELEGVLYYADVTGKIFKRVVANEIVDLPLITGFEKSSVERYPQLSKIYLRQTMEFFSQIRDSDFYRENPISEIRFDPVAGYTVYTLDSGIEIYYGRDNTSRKHRKLEKFVKSGRYDPKRFVRFDLDARDKIIARELSL